MGVAPIRRENPAVITCERLLRGGSRPSMAFFGDAPGQMCGRADFRGRLATASGPRVAWDRNAFRRRPPSAPTPGPASQTRDYTRRTDFGQIEMAHFFKKLLRRSGHLPNPLRPHVHTFVVTTLVVVLRQFTTKVVTTSTLAQWTPTLNSQTSPPKSLGSRAKCAKM